MDAFIIASSALSQQLMPIAGFVVLILLIVVCVKLIKLLSKVIATLNKTDGTIDLVDQSINKLQAPLDTVAKVSKGVDDGFDAGVKALNDAKEYIVKNKDVLKQKTTDAVEKVKSLKKEPSEKTPGPEDIIGG